MKFGDPTSGTLPVIYNNTVYDCSVNFGTIVPSNGGSSLGFVMKNNISLNPKTGGKHIHIANVTTLNLDIDYNLYYPDISGSDNIFTWDGVNSDDFADWQTDSSQDATSPNSADPQLMGAYDSFDDFRINSVDSPAVGAGVDLGNSLNYGLLPTDPDWPPTPGDQDSYGAGWEIGAFIYGPVVPANAIQGVTIN